MTDGVAPAHPTDVVEVAPPAIGGEHEQEPDTRSRSRRAAAVRDTLIRSVVPVILALIAGGVLLLILGTNPIEFYKSVWQNGIQQGSWQDSAMLAAPLLLIAVGLILIFRANLWQLGYDGQYLLGAVMITGIAPHITGLPPVLFWIVLFLVGAVVGARLDADSRADEGVLRDERDHHDADDVVHRHRPRQHPRQGAVPGSDGQHPADEGDPLQPDAAVDSRNEGRHRRHHRPDRSVRRRTRCSRGRRSACVSTSSGANPRAASHVGVNVQAPDHQLVPGQRRVRRHGRLRRHPRRLGVCASELEPGLRRHGDPVRLPGEAQPDRGHPVHRVLRGPVQRRRPCGVEREHPDRLPARARRADPVVHDRDRVLRPAA